jgi:hypothetical protein
LPAAPARCVIGLAMIAITGPECVGHCILLVPRLLASVGKQFGFAPPFSDHLTSQWTSVGTSFLWQMMTLAPLPLIGAALIFHPTGVRSFALMMRRLTKESPR